MVEMKIEPEPWPWPKSLGSKGIEEMYALSPRAYSILARFPTLRYGDCTRSRAIDCFKRTVYLLSD